MYAQVAKPQKPAASLARWQLKKAPRTVFQRAKKQITIKAVQWDSQCVAHTAEAIAQGHCFNDGNKRTAFRSLYAVLGLNGLEPDFETEVIADKIMLLAQSKLSAEDLAAWLRDQ